MFEPFVVFLHARVFSGSKIVQLPELSEWVSWFSSCLLKGRAAVSSVIIELLVGLRIWQPRNRGSMRSRDKSSSFKRQRQQWYPISFPFSEYRRLVTWGHSSRSVTLSTHLRLEPRLRMHGVIPTICTNLHGVLLNYGKRKIYRPTPRDDLRVKKRVSGPVRGTAGYGSGWMEEDYYWWELQTCLLINTDWKHQAFRAACSVRVNCVKCFQDG